MYTILEDQIKLQEVFLVWVVHFKIHHTCLFAVWSVQLVSFEKKNYLMKILNKLKSFGNQKSILLCCRRNNIKSDFSQQLN